MKDRHLFKAKRLDNEEWVRGNLIYTFTGTPYIVAEYDHIINLISINEVDPSTICQCTGLKDKNGNEVNLLSGFSPLMRFCHFGKILNTLNLISSSGIM